MTCMAEINYKIFKDKSCQIPDSSLSAKKDVSNNFEIQVHEKISFGFESIICPFYQVTEEGTGAITNYYEDINTNPMV